MLAEVAILLPIGVRLWVQDLQGVCITYKKNIYASCTCKVLVFLKLMSIISFCKLKLMFACCVPVDRGILPAIDLLGSHALVGVSFKLLLLHIDLDVVTGTQQQQ